MKKMKKLISIVLVVMMTLALAIPAFADAATPEYSITLTPQNETVSLKDQTYSAYKLFDVAYPDANTDGAPDAESYSYTISTSNPFYTNASAKAEIEKYFTLTKSASDETVYVVTPKVDSDNKSIYTTVEARKLADALQPYLPTTADGFVTASDADSATISLSKPGYYLVFGKAADEEADSTETVTAAVSLTTAKKDATAFVKADVPEIDKNIVEGGELVKGTDVNVGDTVTFQLDSKVPDMTGYTTYAFIMHDTMDSGLTLTEDSFVVTVGGTELTAGTDYKLNTDPGDGHTFDISFLQMITYTKGDKIVVTYDAVLNDGAKATKVEDNKVKLQYSNNPYTDGKGETPEIVVHVYDFEIRVDKIDGATEAKLEGATFVLKNAKGTDGKYYKANTDDIEWVDDVADATSFTTDENGCVKFPGLDVGTYYLLETEAPEGYNPLSEEIEVVISASYKADGTIDSTNTTLESDKIYYVSETVENNTGVILPETGGMGTVLFISIGLILFMGTAIVLVTKKRLYNEG